MIACTAAGAALAACARFDVNSPQVRGIAYVRMDDVVSHDPLYGQLSHLDDAIAMVQLTGAAPAVPRSAAEIAREDARLRIEIAQAKARTQQIVNAKQREYRARAQAAIASALAAAGVHDPGAAGAMMGQVSVSQARAAQAQAGRDFTSYQHSVMQQSTDAARAIVRQLQTEANQKLQAKALQEQQRETNLSLQLSQHDATQRLAIQTKLSMLALDETTRHQLQQQLDAMTSRDNAEIAAQRAADQREFAAYRTQVMAQTNDAIRAQVARINDTTRSQLMNRQQTLGAQLRNTLGVPQSTVHLTPATQAQIRAITSRLQQEYQTDVSGVIAQYVATSDALETQYALLHGADAEAAGAAQQEIGLLQQQRSQLYGQIVAHIEQDADRIAAAKGLRVVFSDVTAAPGGYDMTNDLIHDIESEHE